MQTSVHDYAAQGSTATRRRGLDGYIRTSTTVPLTATQGHAHFLNISPANTFSSWVQAGQYQGDLWAFDSGQGSRTAVREYYEYSSPTCGYGGGDLGPRARVNEAYYLETSTTRVTWPCADGTNEYPVYVRIGSVTSPPVATSFTTVSIGYFQATTEVVHLDTDPFPPLGQDRFGLTDTGGVNPSFGLYVLNGTSWNLWTAAQVPGTSTLQDAPPFYDARSAYSAFVTQRTAP